MRFGIAVLGTGRMAETHLEALAHLRAAAWQLEGERVELDLFLYGRDPEKVGRLARAFGVDHAYTSYDELLRHPGLHAVDNCLINALHYMTNRQALEAGLHVFTEKPLTARLEEAEKLVRLAERLGRTHGIVQNMRFQAGPARAREEIRAGRLGTIHHARVVFGYRVPPRVTNRPAWFYQKDAAGGGIVHDMMAHFFDLLVDLLGPVTRVACVTRTCLPERVDAEGRPFRSDVEDVACITVEFASGALADVFLSWVRRRHEEIPFFEIDGDRGSLAFSLSSLRRQYEAQEALFAYNPTWAQEDPWAGWENLPLEPINPFEVQLRAFVEACLAGRPCTPNWRDALYTLRLIEAAYEAAATGRAVRVDFTPETVLERPRE